MDVIVLLLLIGATVSFILATFNVPTRVNTIALGLLFWVLVALLTAGDKVL